MQAKFFRATVYRTTPRHGAMTAGITFDPTPNMTRDDLHTLIADLLTLAHEMAEIEKPRS
jgi:hypothetical protein